MNTELEEGEHEEQDYNSTTIQNININNSSSNISTTSISSSSNSGNSSSNSSNSKSDKIYDKLSFDNIFRTFILDVQDHNDQQKELKSLLELKIEDLSNEYKNDNTSNKIKIEFSELLNILNGHDSVDESIDFIVLFLNQSLNKLNNNEINDKINNNDTISFIFNCYNNTFQWLFIELVYEYIVNKSQDSTDRMESIVYISNLLAKHKESTTTIINRETLLLYVILIPLLWESNFNIIDNIIRYIGSLISFSISIELYNVLDIISRFQSLFKAFDKPRLLQIKNHQTKSELSQHLKLPMLDQLFDSNNVNKKQLEVEWSNQNSSPFTFYLTNILLIDHVILSESNSFETIPQHSKRFTLSILKVILYYLNPLSSIELPCPDIIVPKFISLVVNHWLAVKPTSFIAESVEDNNNDEKILQSIANLCIFGRLLADFNLISSNLDRLHSILLNLLFRANEDSNVKELVKSNFTAEFFGNCVKKINESTDVNPEFRLHMADRLAQIIQLTNASIDNVDSSKMDTSDDNEDKNNNDNNNNNSDINNIKHLLSKLELTTPLIEMVLNS